MRPLISFVCLIALSIPVGAQEKGWTDLFANKMEGFKGGPKFGDWHTTTAITLDAKNPKLLVGKDEPGPIWINGDKGRTNNLFSKQNFGDVEVHMEFVMGKNSNSGIKFHGHYEVQLRDSFGKTKLSGDDCGGIYPRAEAKPKYHHIDDGVAPLVNSCKAPGEWQEMDIVFTAPRFDSAKKKIQNAKVHVILNGKVVQDQKELLTPTGDRWPNPEMAEGPIMIQGDHGPVAFRNVKVRVPAPSK